MNHNFAVIILGGTGQVGGAAVAELVAIPECREVVMVTRRPITPRSRVRNVVLDTGAADFADRTATLAREISSQGPVSAVSCAGVGSGSARWTEEELKRLELGVVGLICARLPPRRNRAVLFAFCGRKHSPKPVSLCPHNGHEGRRHTQYRFCSSRYLSPRRYCWQRSYPGLGRLVGKPRAWAVRQYRSANSRSRNRCRDSFA